MLIGPDCGISQRRRHLPILPYIMKNNADWRISPFTSPKRSLLPGATGNPLTYRKITIFCKASQQEILIAELSHIGYDGFLELEEGLEAFIQQEAFKKSDLSKLMKAYDIQTDAIQEEILQDRNWNAAWEKNFNPVVIANKVLIRAGFHDVKKKFPYEIIIDPKQSFGTGHHETTSMMMEAQLAIDHRQKHLLDVGSGTGILAILGAKLGAKSGVATDTDTKCIESCMENFELNGVKNVELHHGSIEKLTLKSRFDIVLANINLNVLKNEIGAYVNYLRPGGYLLLSGFYASDSEEIGSIAQGLGLSLDCKLLNNNWNCIVFTKKK